MKRAKFNQFYLGNTFIRCPHCDTQLILAGHWTDLNQVIRCHHCKKETMLPFEMFRTCSDPENKDAKIGQVIWSSK